MLNALTNANHLVVFLTVFVATFMSDVLYVWYTWAVTERKSLQAAISSMLIHLIIACNVCAFVTNVLYIIPAVVGAGVGTWLTVKLGSKRP